MANSNRSKNDLADVVLSKNTKNKEAFAIVVLILGVVALSIYAINAYIANEELIKKAKQEAAYERQKRIEAEIEKARLDQLLRHQQLDNYKSRYSNSSTTYQPKTTSRVYEQRVQTQKPSKQTYAYNSQQTYKSQKENKRA